MQVKRVHKDSAADCSLTPKSLRFLSAFYPVSIPLFESARPPLRQLVVATAFRISIQSHSINAFGPSRSFYFPPLSRVAFPSHRQHA
ncbi:hypothetical protein CLOM_g17026 [Closterium sp. NIES-68]|nr:hypothetical protein CLOM_g17026 [Closterium sp. NIES-68]